MRETEALVRAVVAQFEQYVKLNKKVPPEVLVSLSQIDDPAKLADTVAAHLSLKISDKQELLETGSLAERLERLYGFMEGEISVLQVEKRIRSRVKRQMEKTQREYYLNEQMKAIQKELGELEDGKDEASELEARIKKTKLTKEARDKARAELKKLRTMSPMSAEATVVRNYLDWMLSLPWKKRTKVSKDIKIAQSILDTDHYGLEKVKERIVEYLAVQQRVDKMKGPILCLVGPPGRRQDLARQVAGQGDGPQLHPLLAGRHPRRGRDPRPSPDLYRLDARQDRPVDEEGEDRPTRCSCWTRSTRWARTSAATRPRRCSRCWTRSRTSTSTTTISRSTTTSRDVMFVCTANTLRMPQPLLDRMEIIRLAGYTEDEKVEIAKRHLIPKQRKEHGLKDGEWAIDDDGLHGPDPLLHPRGRRALARARDRQPRPQVGQGDRRRREEVGRRSAASNLGDYAGVRKYRYGEAELEDQVGVVTGLAWTEVGGELLTIEAVTVPGKGKMTITGKLGDVMQELVQAAKSYVRSRALMLGIKPEHVRQGRHPHPRAGGRDAQGRPVGRHRDGDLDRLGADQDPGQGQRSR